MMENAYSEIIRVLDLPVSEKDTNLHEQLANRINDLLVTNLDRLISILYRMDVNESKIKRVLAENEGTDAGKLIADLMIERQQEKILAKKKYRMMDDTDDSEEKW